MRVVSAVLLASLWCSSLALAAPKDRETKVREDKQRMEADESWIYNDLDEGRLVAKRAGKPLLVVFRCVP